MAYVQFIAKPIWLSRFYVGYLFSLIPFFIVNGILTYLPVVTYDNAENLGIRLFTIPIEDTIYCLLLLLMNVTMYEWLKERS
jgi:lycopene cyclase domain-containing protein